MKNLNWIFYLISQEAMITGFHEISEKSLLILKLNLISTSDDNTIEWISSLQKLSTAENNLTKKNFLITKSIEFLNSSIISIETCKSIIFSKFQIDFLKLRCEFLECCNQILISIFSINLRNEQVDFRTKKVS